MTTLVVGTVAAVACTVWAVRLEVPYQVALLAGYITLAATACLCAALVAVRYSAPATGVVARNAEAEAAAEQSEPEATAAKFEAETAAAKSETEVTTEKIESGSILEGGRLEETRTEEARAESSVPRSKPKSSNRKRVPDYAAWKHAGELRVADAARLWCGIEPGCHATAEVMEWASTMLDAIDRGELPKSGNTAILAQYKNGWHTAIQTDALRAWAKAKGYSPRFLVD